MGESPVKTIEDIGSGMRCGDIVLTWYDGSILADLIRLFTKDGPSTQRFTSAVTSSPSRLSR